jgi:hypothetical protein
VQGDIFLEAVEGRQVFDLAILGDILPTMRSAPPTIDIGVIGYDESIKRHSRSMASVKKSVMQRIAHKEKSTNVFARRNLSDIGPSMLTSMKNGRLLNTSIVCTVRKSWVTKFSRQFRVTWSRTSSADAKHSECP